MVLTPNWDAVVAIAIPNIVGLAAGVAVIGQITNKDGTAWFQTIKKPSWFLPNWAFGPIFPIMYTCLGYASYLIYANSPGNIEHIQAALYGAHLLLTLIIAFVFYKFHKIPIAFFLTLMLDGLLLEISIYFYQANSYTAIFLIPLQAWQTYATLLLHALWVLNTKKDEDCQNLKV